ncbi:hypothetical protein [Blautia producta]|uniref:Uncharacterized protein n=1 Tax=Blautia producta ATCC 27340 = DSM 2950 TaxID=1121114 RepID=A0ABX6J418_9FIRM|nr:hypothetical protein [Blautia producta]QIB54190.1 hypothetical protein GXM18_04520 [Blautia producta ATCC 27340 = DSM 2950]
MNENVVKDILKKIRSGEIAPSEGKKLLSKSKCIMDGNMEKAIVLTKPMSISDVRLENISMHDPKVERYRYRLCPLVLIFQIYYQLKACIPICLNTRLHRDVNVQA